MHFIRLRCKSQPRSHTKKNTSVKDNTNATAMECSKSMLLMSALTCWHFNCGRGRLLGVPSRQRRGARMTAAAEAALAAGGYKDAAN